MTENKVSKTHPDLQDALKKIPAINYNKMNLWLIRLGIALIPGPKAPAEVSIENIFIAGKDEKSKIRLRIYHPKATQTNTPVLLWIHGGGYIIGKPEMEDTICIQFVRELGISIVSVDYRLAPKHAFPAGLEDCYSALIWIKQNSESFGFDITRIAIGGTSAGGGLAASLAQLAHDRKEVTPVFQLLTYPMLDDRTALHRDIDDSNSPAWSQKSNRFGWESYLGEHYGADEILAYAVPARREDLTGLPPAWIGVGTLDVFYEEDMMYAQRMKEAGIECDLNVVEGAFHGFDVIDQHLYIVQEFRKSQIDALKKYLIG
ncbi:MAG: alpha/beta hydrolase [Anaerolineales bacterium]|nr:alpha/beta hydrolase [Anaerolineales bacterium]